MRRNVLLHVYTQKNEEKIAIRQDITIRGTSHLLEAITKTLTHTNSLSPPDVFLLIQDIKIYKCDKLTELAHTTT